MQTNESQSQIYSIKKQKFVMDIYFLLCNKICGAIMILNQMIWNCSDSFVL